MKFVKPIILILVIIASAIFFADKIGYFKTDACATKQVQTAVNIKYDDLSNNEAGQALIKKVDLSIYDGYINRKDKEKTLKANLELTYRTDNSCTISDDLKFDATESYIFEGVGTQCPENQFSEQAKSDYEQIKSSENYKYFEEKAFISVTPQIANDKAKEKFTARWESNADFRETLILALLDMGLRQKNNCTNINLPMVKVNQEIKKYNQLEGQ